jgi:hypothetical protein
MYLVLNYPFPVEICTLYAMKIHPYFPFVLIIEFIECQCEEGTLSNTEVSMWLFLLSLTHFLNFKVLPMMGPLELFCGFQYIERHMFCMKS